MKKSLLLSLPLIVACGSTSDGKKCERSFTDEGDVRVFVVGHQHRLEDATSYETYEASYRRHMEEIGPCLSEQRPNLVVFPESAGLVAMLLGDRGREARRATDSNTAFVTALESYRSAYQHYQSEFRGISLARALTLSVQDVVYRAVTRTFGGIARDHQVWVLTSADLGELERSDDPALIEKLGDPEVDDGVYVARSPEVYNAALLFSPEGELVDRVNKVFLTDSEEDSLDLQNGSLSDLRVMKTPFANIGVAISRDAWYPPFMQRLEDLGADLIVQPEAFAGGWTVEATRSDEWLPDVFLASGWLHTQKHRTFRHSLAPQLVGNFFEIIFDGQVHVTKRAHPGDAPLAYVGQPPMPGFAAVGPWVEAPADQTADRAAARAIGEALAPGSGDPRENGYAEAWLGADLIMGGTPVEPARDADRPMSRPVAPAEGNQMSPAPVALAGGGVLLAFEEEGRVRYVISSDGGESFDAPVTLGDGVRPSACARAEEALVVWQSGEPGEEAVRFAKIEGGAVAGDGEVAAGPGARWEPDCALLEDRILVTYTELDQRGVPRVAYATSPRSGPTFTPGGEVDPSTRDAPRVEGSQAQPTLSEAGDLVFIDYRDRSWDVYYARFEGDGFTPAVRIDGVPSDSERLHADPRVVRAEDGTVAVAYAALYDRRPFPDIAVVTSTGGAWTRSVVPGGPEAEPAGLMGGAGRPRFRPDIVSDAGGFTLVFQDLAPDKSGIFGAAAGGDPERIDDTADAPVALTRPRVVSLPGGRLVAWEDDRDGAYQIYVARW